MNSWVGSVYSFWNSLQATDFLFFSSTQLFFSATSLSMSIRRSWCHNYAQLYELASSLQTLWVRPLLPRVVMTLWCRGNTGFSFSRHFLCQRRSIQHSYMRDQWSDLDLVTVRRWGSWKVSWSEATNGEWLHCSPQLQSGSCGLREDTDLKGCQW